MNEPSLRQKYYVDRVGDLSGKHDECWYFVLDPTHDPKAVEALRFYANAVREDRPHLAAAIDARVANAQARH